MKKKLFILLLLGLILRLVISVMGHHGDIDNYHIVWAKSVMDNGIVGFYSRIFDGVRANYPPLSILIFSFLYKLYFLIDALLWKINIMVPLFPSALVILWRNPAVVIPALMKLPAILADLGLAYLLYRWTKKPLAAAFILFNPAFFFNSSFWGQIDVIPILFVMGTFYYVVIIRREQTCLFPTVMFMIGLLIKQTVIVFLPLYLLVVWKKNGLKNLLKSLVIPLILIFVVFLPFYQSNNFFIFALITFWDKITTGFGSVYLTANAYNFWALATGLGHIKDEPFRFLSLSLVGISSIIILFKLYKRGFKTRDIIWAGFLIPWTIFLFATRMHERHLLLTLPFLLLAGIENRTVMKIFIYLSFFHFLNLYSAGWFAAPDYVVKILIVITIAFFSYLYYHYLKGDYAA